LFKKSQDRGINVFVDDDWAGSIEDNRFTFGFCIKLCKNLVTWRSKKQLIVTRSSAEAEFRAIAQGICELIWVEKMMEDLQLSMSSPKVFYCDSKSTISIVNNPVQQERMKRVRIDPHFVKKEIERGHISLIYIPIKFQEANILTKAMHKQGFKSI